MPGWIPRLLVLLLVSIASSRCIADEDMVKVKLDKAKAGYDEAMNKFRMAVGEYFNKREDAARKDGNKKLVDEIKADRQTFDEKGEVPNTAPAVLKQKATAASITLENAYILAIKEYTRAKLDDEAAATEKELAAFKAGFTAADTRRRWVHDEAEFKMIGKNSWGREVGSGEEAAAVPKKRTTNQRVCPTGCVDG